MGAPPATTLVSQISGQESPDVANVANVMRTLIQKKKHTTKTQPELDTWGLDVFTIGSCCQQPIQQSRPHLEASNSRGLSNCSKGRTWGCHWGVTGEPVISPHITTVIHDLHSWDMGPKNGAMYPLRTGTATFRVRNNISHKRYSVGFVEK